MRASTTHFAGTFSVDQAKKLREQFDEAIAQLVELRSEAVPLARLAMTHAERLERAKYNSLERGRFLLARKLGDNHPRVAALTARIGSQQTLRRAAETVDARTAAPAPKPGKDAIAIFGRVVGTDGTPLRGARVVALGPTGKKVGESATDPQGGFDIRLAARSATRSTTTAAAASRPVGSLKPMQLRLEVRSSGGNVLHRESAPMVVQPGIAVHREIIVGPSAPDTKSATHTSPKATSRPAPARSVGRGAAKRAKARKGRDKR